MSQQENQDIATNALSKEDVAIYLSSNPHFFEENPDLLIDLKFSHHAGSDAVSLVERQIDVLRQSNSKLTRQLNELVAVAKDNHVVLEKIHQLALNLMKSKTSIERIKLLEATLKTSFLADKTVLILFSSVANDELSNNSFTRIVDDNDENLNSFASFLRSNQPRCGQLKDDQKTFVFEHGASEIKSSALIPLGEPETLGFIVIGSKDPDHFNPGKGMDFLSRLGEVVTAALLFDAAVSAKNGPNVAGS